MLPDQLAAWTIENVRQLVAKGVFESDLFEFKEMLPPDDGGKHRLRKTCAAFANTTGGFIIFGVAADVRLTPPARMVGLDVAVDFPAQFGNFPGSVSPAIDWQFKAPALPLANGRLIHIVHVPRSWRAPHAVQDGDAWAFPKRTNKGTEPMSYAEVQGMFLGYYEKRLKLQLLRAELAQLAEHSGMILLSTDQNELSMSYLPPLSLQVLESVLSDTYSITYGFPSLLQALARLRPAVQNLNSRTEILRQAIALYPSHGQYRMSVYSNLLQHLKYEVGRLSSEAITELDKIR